MRESKSLALPLGYTPMVEESGFEPLNPKERIYSPSRLATSLLLHGGAGQNRTADTWSFNPLLYQLSYRAKITWYFYNNNETVWTGLEPATSCVTGRHSNQLNYQTIFLVFIAASIVRTEAIAGAGFEPTTFGL